MVKKKTATNKAATKKKVVKKRPNKKSSRREKPKVVAIVACDSILQQMPMGKPALVGVFDSINVTDPEKPFRPFTLMTKLYGGKGKFLVGVRIETPNGVADDRSHDQELHCNPGEIYQGTITVGKLADFVVLSDNLLTLNPNSIKDVTVRTTVVGGKLVYSAD